MQSSPLPFCDFGVFLKKAFPYKVQRIAVDAGFTCPNRDGTKGTDGCIYCNNATFNPSYCQPQQSVSAQIEEGKVFFRRKYPSMKYLAYFQAYSNTYAPLETLKRLYEEALSVPDVVGLVIATRPDCISESLLDYLTELKRHHFVMLEYGIESVDDRVLQKIHRGHCFVDTIQAVTVTAKRGIPVSGHVILGLPGERDDYLPLSAKQISALPLTSLKIHQLQIVKGTLLGRQYEENPNNFHLPTAKEYIDTLITYLGFLRPDLYIDRLISQSPGILLLAPKWGLKSDTFKHLLITRMIERQAHQGCSFSS